MKKRICTNECPLPICNLPDLLTPKQMRMAMIHLGIVNKEIAAATNMCTSTVGGTLTVPNKFSMTNRHKVSDYLKAKLIEKSNG